jgi:hypothetical protein
MSNKGGWPAFPVADYDHQIFQPKNEAEAKRYLSGMSLRDYFAAKALQGICAHQETWGLQMQQIAESAYEAADAMLVAGSQP